MGVPTATAAGETPKPLVRGPQQAVPSSATILKSDEEARCEKAFNKHDKMKTGEIDLVEFYAMCESLQLPLQIEVAQEWLAGRSEAKGLTLEDFKLLYGQILAAQTPAVRKVTGNGNLGLGEMVGTESAMRAAFQSGARNGALSTDGLRGVLRSLGFPDRHGDGFDRFVGEWLIQEDKEETGTLNFHEFVSCVNFLIDFCKQEEEEAQQPAEEEYF